MASRPQLMLSELLVRESENLPVTERDGSWMRSVGTWLANAFTRTGPSRERRSRYAGNA